VAIYFVGILDRGAIAQLKFRNWEGIVSLAVTATFMLADYVVKGLADGTFERVGGVIREIGTKHVVAWLKESGTNAVQLPTSNNPSPNFLSLIVSGANLVTSGANTAIVGKGLANVNQRLGGIEQQVGNIQQTLQQAQGILQMSTAASILGLCVSVMGFAAIAQRLKELEQRLQTAQELLNKIDRKIDLGYYANFRAALDLAINAFTMSKSENRRSSALQAINRFLEAQHIYTKYIDLELEQKSQIVDEYIMTLSLAYIAEIRCYLELEEHDTALRRFQEGSLVLRSLIQKYVELLLTSNPAAYLQPEFRGKIDLQRLTKIYQWIDPVFNENAVFEMQREDLIKLAQEPNKWIDSLPSAILDRVEVPWGIFGPNPEDLKKEATKRLPQTMEVIESMIETYNRLESYQSEVKAIAQLGISFQDWLKLAPAEAKPEKAELMYIIPSAPL
jgi:tetratricopeptide (TPR) repeat protein